MLRQLTVWTGRVDKLLLVNRDVRKPNFGSVSVFKNRNRIEAKRSNPKFRLSHTNSQYLSLSHKALTLRTLSVNDHEIKLSVDTRAVN